MTENIDIKESVVQEVVETKDPDLLAIKGQPTKFEREEINYRELRASKKQLEKERDEMAQIIRNYEINNKEKPVEEDEIPLKADDLVEGKHLTKLGRKFKNLETKLAKQEEQARQNVIETQLRARYSDFDSVVCGSNFNELKEKNPVIARAISSSTDLFAAGSLAYEEIKRSGIGATDKYAKDHEIAKENSNKPRPLASVSPQEGESPLSHANAFANGLTPELRKKLLKEMEDCRKAF